MRKNEITVLIIILISFLIGIYLYNKIPERMASHWNIQGEVDSYISKFWGLFLMPIISFVLFLLFITIPKIDPLKQNIAKFRKYFDMFVVIIMLFLFYLYSLTILWNFELRFNIILALTPAFSVLFFFAGVLIENAKRNWFIGIRTPWTLSSDKVWNKTHKLGGKLFKAVGIINLLGIVFANYSFYLLLFSVIFVTFYLSTYSYFEYQKIKKVITRKK